MTLLVESELEQLMYKNARREAIVLVIMTITAQWTVLVISTINSLSRAKELRKRIPKWRYQTSE